MVHCKLHVLRRCNQCPLWNFISLSLCRSCQISLQHNIFFRPFSFCHFIYILKILEILNMCRIKILRAYFIYHSVPCACIWVAFCLSLCDYLCVCVCESNANKIMSYLCTSILRKATEIVESKEKLSKYPVMYAVGAVLIIMGCVVEENRIFHFCRPLHPLAPHSLV